MTTAADIRTRVERDFIVLTKRLPKHLAKILLYIPGARHFDPLPLKTRCPEAVSIQRILDYLGEPVTPPPMAPARGPPYWEDDLDQTPLYDPALPPRAPDYKFDQTFIW